MKLELAPSEISPADARAEPARARFSLHRVESAASPDFEVAFAALHAEFAHRGELERRDVIERWVSRPSGRIGSALTLDWQWVLLVARDRDGALAGVRDAHVTFDRAARIVVVYLAHTLVLPDYRRSGLGALLRAAPLAIARRWVTDLDPRTSVDVLAAAEMEPLDPADEASRIRLAAYDAAGFGAIPRDILPYAQPDFRDPTEIRGRPEPVPLLAVVRHEGHARSSPLPATLARAFLEHLYAVFATHCLAEHLAPSLARSRAALAAWGDPVDLRQLVPNNRE